ncbi:MAG: GYF domain-containing protein [Bradymonadales bacterium]|jgi:predicted Zn finger-like uncharacterized protein
MRIVCDQCQASYLVPDEKIVKSVVRLQCRHCDNQILMRVDLANVKEETSKKLEKWRSSSARPAISPTRSLADWYFSVNGESRGPFRKDELIQRFETGEAPESSFVWHKSLVEWKPALEVEAFSSAILAKNEPPPPPPPPAPFLSKSSSYSLPPLLNSPSPSSSGKDVLRRSKPNIAGLKNRLEQTPSTNFDAVRRTDSGIGLEELARLGEANSSQNSSPSIQGLKDISLPEISLDVSIEEELKINTELEDKFLDIDEISIDLASQESDVITIAQSDAVETSREGDEAISIEPSDRLLDAIDLDESTQVYSQQEIDAITNPSEEFKSSPNKALDSEEIKRIVFGDSNEVARVSTVEKSVRQSDDIFAKIDLLREAEEDLEPLPSAEHSMLLQIEHLQNVQRKQIRRLFILAFLLLGVVGIGVFAFIFLKNDEEPTQVQYIDRSLASVEGSYVDEDELSRYTPEDDFEIITQNIHYNTKPERSNGNARQNTANAHANSANGSKLPNADAEPSKLANSAALPSLGRRDSIQVIPKTIQQSDATNFVQASKYAGLKRPGQSDRLAFNSGLKSVSRTIQECHKRELKMGQASVSKIYINIVVQPNGTVKSYKVDSKQVSQNFLNCLDAKKDRWVFQAFEGENIELRQGFVLE